MYILTYFILTFYNIFEVTKVRVFYIYNVNDFFCSVYDKYPYKLYKMLEDGTITIDDLDVYIKNGTIDAESLEVYLKDGLIEIEDLEAYISSKIKF